MSGTAILSNCPSFAPEEKKQTNIFLFISFPSISLHMIECAAIFNLIQIFFGHSLIITSTLAYLYLSLIFMKLNGAKTKETENFIVVKKIK